MLDIRSNTMTMDDVSKMFSGIIYDNLENTSMNKKQTRNEFATNIYNLLHEKFGDVISLGNKTLMLSFHTMGLRNLLFFKIVLNKTDKTRRVGMSLRYLYTFNRIEVMYKNDINRGALDILGSYDCDLNLKHYVDIIKLWYQVYDSEENFETYVTKVMEYSYNKGNFMSMDTTYIENETKIFDYKPFNSKWHWAFKEILRLPNLPPMTNIDRGEYIEKFHYALENCGIKGNTFSDFAFIVSKILGVDKQIKR